MFNTLLAEFQAVVLAAGLTLDPTNNAQMLAAAYKLFGGQGSVGTNGYMPLPGGLIVQWGTGTLPNSGTHTSGLNVTLPIAWPIGYLSATAGANSGANSSTGGLPSMGATANTSSTIFFTADALGWANFNQSVTFQYIALGH